MVASHNAGFGICDLPRRVAKAVPDGFAFAGLVPSDLDLIRGSGGAPQEISRKTEFVHKVNRLFGGIPLNVRKQGQDLLGGVAVEVQMGVRGLA